MKITSHEELNVWQDAMTLAMKVFFLTKAFPPEEKYSATDQMRRSSRSVAANISEAWQKRRYKNAFVAKLSDSLGENSETQTWIEICMRCGYIPEEEARELKAFSGRIAGQLITMIQQPEVWVPRDKAQTGN